MSTILIIFTIFIIQTGFAILEGGCTTLKNEVSSLFTKMKLMAIMSMVPFFKIINIQVMVMVNMMEIGDVILIQVMVIVIGDVILIQVMVMVMVIGNVILIFR